jgi:hypothetical protein
VALWPTSAALALVVLITGGCGHDPAPSATATAAARPRIAPVQQQPLVVKGTGFHPGEHVQLAAKGLRSDRAAARADGSGEFEATFHGLKSCDSVTVVAVGSQGSRAELNLSQIACTDT